MHNCNQKGATEQSYFWRINTIATFDKWPLIHKIFILEVQMYFFPTNGN